MRQSRPRLTSADKRLERLYDSALDNLLTINTVPSPDLPRRMVFRAGAGYPQPWTRDSAINCWFAGSLLNPQIAESTLLSCLEGTGAMSMIRQDNQWWDQIIWVIAAWRHYLITHHMAFARTAYVSATNTLRALDRHYDPKLGLYRGGAVMQDGIAGYPRHRMTRALTPRSSTTIPTASECTVCPPTLFTSKPCAAPTASRTFSTSRRPGSTERTK